MQRLAAMAAPLRPALPHTYRDRVNMPIDTKELRNALGKFATGVTIVTTRDAAGTDIGVTANSFNSVSLDPPLILWSLAKSSASLSAFNEAEHFAVHILAADQESLSNRFAQRGIDKFAALAIARGSDGIPLLHDCAARLQCRLVHRYEGGDHVILIGQVIDFEHCERKPLAYLSGRYAYTLHKPASSPSDRLPGVTVSGFDRNWLSYLAYRTTRQFIQRHRPTLRMQGLHEADAYVLNILLAQGNLLPEQIRSLIDDPCLDMPVILQGLAQRGLILLNEGDAATVRLSNAGRNLAIDLIAATKALEEEAEHGMEPSEVLLLKELLWKVIRNTHSPAQPLLSQSTPQG
ncbi:p-hydroxyphenylacetate 3-hydroxylase, reductase component [compost metagenome]